MRGLHMKMGSSMEDNRFFGGDRNPERRSRPRMPGVMIWLVITHHRLGVGQESGICYRI